MQVPMAGDTKSVRVGTLNMCSHNNWQPTREQCEQCSANMALFVPTKQTRVSTRLGPLTLTTLEKPYSATFVTVIKP